MNGVPSCANTWLNDQTARGEWGFDGYITSDCDADADVFNAHHFTHTKEEAVAAVLKAGTDIDCTSFVPRNLASALHQGLVREADLDVRLTKLFMVRMRLGHFVDRRGPLDEIPSSALCSEATWETALDGVAQSATLLKNEGGALPLAASASVAVIGPTANLSSADASYYGPADICGGTFWTLVDAVVAHAKATVTTALGVPTVTSANTSAVGAAAALARAADRVVLALGTDLTWASEGRDADPVSGISLSAGQLALLEAVTKAASAPVVVVLLTATPLDLSLLLANPKVGAILHVGQPAVAVLGVGRVLYGVVSPAGRMIQTVYPTAYATSVSIFDFHMRPGPSAWPAPGCTAKPCPNGTNPGRTYRFYTGQPVVPFGYGLSYTTFHYSARAVARPSAISATSAASEATRRPTPWLAAAAAGAETTVVDLTPVRALLSRTERAGRTFPPSDEIAAAAPLVQYAVNVTNTGAVDADDVVLGFLTPPGAGRGGMPLKSLFGFERVHVPAGQSRSVFLYPSLLDFAPAGADGTRAALAGEYSVSFGLREAVSKGMGFAEANVLAQ